MTEQSENYQNMQLVSKNASKCIMLLEQFEGAKIILADGETEIDLPAEVKTILIQKFVAKKQEGIAAWNAVTAG